MENAAAPAAPTTPSTTQTASPGTPSTGGQSSAQQHDASTSRAASAGGAGAPNPASPAKHWEIKANGKTMKLTEEELISRASMSEAADQRFQEAAQMRKQAESVLGRMRDPEKVIELLMDPRLGLDKNQIRAKFEDWYAKEFIEPESLTPDQKKLREAQTRIQKYEEAEKAMAAQKQKDQQDSLTSQARDEIQNQIIDTLKSSDLPKTNFTLKRLAYWMQRNQANNFEAPKEVLVAQVKREFNENLRDMVQSSDGDVLIKLFEGTDIINKVRKYDLEQLRARRGQGQSSQQQDPMTPKPERTDRPLTSREVNDRIRSMQRNGNF